MSIPDSELVGKTGPDDPKMSLFRGAPRDILAVGAVGLALAVGFGLGDVTGKAGVEKGSQAPQTVQIEDLGASAANCCHGG
ncbi:MAG: hypothetical protein ABA06_01980 [Parcubacteria bacterium C7867-001]|nr:MAG: hypothetical protein ABA06_01980 [Parcubacteria bacterium C7867-001]